MSCKHQRVSIQNTQRLLCSGPVGNLPAGRSYSLVTGEEIIRMPDLEPISKPGTMMGPETKMDPEARAIQRCPANTREVLIGGVKSTWAHTMYMHRCGVRKPPRKVADTRDAPEDWPPFFPMCGASESTTKQYDGCSICAPLLYRDIAMASEETVSSNKFFVTRYGACVHTIKTCYGLRTATSHAEVVLCPVCDWNGF